MRVRKYESTKVRGDEGTRGRRYEGTKVRGDEGTRGRRYERTNHPLVIYAYNELRAISVPEVTYRSRELY